MRFSNIFLIILFVTFTNQSSRSLHAHAVQSPYEIPEITKDDELFTALTSRNSTVLIGTMAHCSHCKSLMQKVEKLPKKYQKINFLMIDGAKKKLHVEVAKRLDHIKPEDRKKYNIPGYPSVVFIKNGIIQDVQIGGNEKTLEEKIKKLISIL